MQKKTLTCMYYKLYDQKVLGAVNKRAKGAKYSREQRKRGWGKVAWDIYQDDYLSLPFTLIDKSCCANEWNSTSEVSERKEGKRENLTSYDFASSTV